MKNWLHFICLLLITGILFSQNTYQDSLKANVVSDIINGIQHKQLLHPLIKSELLFKNKVDIKSDHWDTSAFEPYRKSVLQFPLKIKFYDSVFSSPITKPKVVTSRYGWRGGRPHKGTDIDLNTGDTVISVLDGIVRFANYDSGYGKTIVIRHYNGLETSYTHLSDFNIKINDTVMKGQMIAKGGNTGRSKGSHLHFITTYKGQYINPEYLFDFSEVNKIRAEEFLVTEDWTKTVFRNPSEISEINFLTTEKKGLTNKGNTKHIYLVKSGDTLSRISLKNNVSIAALCRANGIRKTSTLKIGQKLILNL
jgi:murein DD-endopeptidase MepM/ murein hydrolase activator NlpD